MTGAQNSLDYNDYDDNGDNDNDNDDSSPAAAMFGYLWS